MDLQALVAWAAQQGASDLHLEPGLPAALRVRGVLRADGDPIPARVLAGWISALLDAEAAADFERKGSADLSASLGGRRCRINVLRSSRGPGIALRLLSSHAVTLDSLNLHPDFTRLVDHPHGLIVVSGATGSGKSSTLAALVQEINLSRACHIVTIEQPIEYELRPARAFIRQREVGRDTPSFGQALLDSMREDPDVLMVGEMRDRETMRLTLDACETGHLVMATLHSATVVEALQRIVSAFPAEEQTSVCAQLADVLVAVVSQRLVFREDLGIRVPECELLLGTPPVRSTVRQGQLFRLQTTLDTGGQAGQWTRERYRAWLAKRTEWHLPDEPAAQAAPPPRVAAPRGAPAPLATPAAGPTAPTASRSAGLGTPAPLAAGATATPLVGRSVSAETGGAAQTAAATAQAPPANHPFRDGVAVSPSQPAPPPYRREVPMTPDTSPTVRFALGPHPRSAPIAPAQPAEPPDDEPRADDIFVIEEEDTPISELLGELEDDQGA